MPEQAKSNFFIILMYLKVNNGFLFLELFRKILYVEFPNGFRIDRIAYQKHSFVFV